MTNRRLSKDDSVAIVILNWNGWEDTVECLQSVYGLRYNNFKVFLVDNASENDSVDRILKFFPDIDIIKSDTNLGFSGGNNIAIRKALAEGFKYFWLLNNDTTVNSESLAALVEKFKSDDDLGLLGSVVIEYYRPEKIQAWGGGYLNRFLALTGFFDLPVADEKIDHILGASMFTSNEVLKRVGLLDEDFFFFMEDTEFSLRVKRLYKLGVAENSFVYHKGGSSLKNQGSHKNLSADQYYVASVARFIRKRNSLFSGLSALSRLLLIVLNRIKKGEASRIPLIIKAFVKGYGSQNRGE